MIDLKLCYDRQLAQIESIVQELIGVKRLLIKLFAKLILVIEHHIYTSFGVSKEFYGGWQLKQAGIGQGYVVLVNICRDSICFIFKVIQEERIGIIIIAPITKAEE